MLSIVNKIDPLIFRCVCFVCDTNMYFSNTEKSIGESGATTGGLGKATEGICASFEKRSKIEEEDREARK